MTQRAPTFAHPKFQINKFKTYNSCFCIINSPIKLTKKYFVNQIHFYDFNFYVCDNKLLRLRLFLLQKNYDFFVGVYVITVVYLTT